MPKAVSTLILVVCAAVAGFAASKVPSLNTADSSSTHAEGDHSGHDHSGHDHSGHDHGDSIGASASGFDSEPSLPPGELLIDSVRDGSDDSHAGQHHDDYDHSSHAGHDHGDHDHHGHDDENSIALSAQARANLRLEVEKLSTGTFVEYVDVPAVVTNWPGRTHIFVTSPLTGVISAIHVARGELIQGGTPLFTLRLTHQDLVNTQQQFLTQLGQLDVEQREIARLSAIASTGAVAGKTLINRQYERDKLIASIKAARQSMLLHGLTKKQIESIEETRQLIREIRVDAPEIHSDYSLHHASSPHHDHSHDHGGGSADPSLPPTFDGLSSGANDPSHELSIPHVEHIDVDLLVTRLEVHRGQAIEAGAVLAELSDYSEVLIEGHAFQRDGDAVRRAAQNEAALQAVLESSDNPEVIDDLKIVSIGNEIDRLSRALKFYVELTNEIERSDSRDNRRYVSWRYKPGQRLNLRLPISQRENVIVVPKEAVAEEGPDRYVFTENGDHFDRVAVTVVASDSTYVALANDGQVLDGQTIAIKGAHQLQMAMRNKAAGPVDMHAGHSH